MSLPDPLGSDVARFLRERVESVTQLEILLLVRAGPSSSIEIARGLGISPMHAMEELRRLERSGLVVRDDVVVSLCADPDVSQPLDSLAALYPRFRVAVTRAIFADV